MISRAIVEQLNAMIVGLGSEVRCWRMSFNHGTHDTASKNNKHFVSIAKHNRNFRLKQK